LRLPRLAAEPAQARYILAALAAASVASIAFALMVGSVAAPWSDVIDALRGARADSLAAIVFDLRLPRALSAFAVGALLALAGALLQALLRNPLADPYVLGISGGASVAALLALALGAALWVMQLASALGALVTLMALVLLARRSLFSRDVLAGDDAAISVARELSARARRLLGRAVAIREVDAGSCNGCELEISGLTGPVYDSERFGIHFVASPRHADLLLVTGPVTRNMEVPLRKTWEATPEPKLVVAVGDCARTCGVFRGGYGVVGSVDRVVPVDVFVDGCPPEPAEILRGILTAVERGGRR